MKRKYKVGDVVSLGTDYDTGLLIIATVVRINGRGYNVQRDIGIEYTEQYVTARDILRLVTPLELALK